MAVHSLTFGQTSCWYKSSSRWSQFNLTCFLVKILPAVENMRSGTAEVAGKAKTFLPKRAIHGITEEARLNSVRGFLCDGNACRRILHIDWCCFYYFLRNSSVALLEALFARIFLDLRYRCAEKGDLFVGNVGTRLVHRARRSWKCCRKPVDRLAIISDMGAHGLIRPGFVNEHHQHVLDMHSSCFYLSWGATRKVWKIPSIETSSHDLDLWRVSCTEREKETIQRRQRECGIRVCAFSKKRDRQDRTREERIGLSTHESAREGMRANEKSTHVGSIDSPCCSHEVGEKGLRNPPRTRLNHPQTLSQNPRSPKSTLEFPSLNPPTRDAWRWDQHGSFRG